MKVIKWIAVAIIVCGFVLMLGTAGASDIDAISVDVAIVRLFGALAMMGIGYGAIYIIEKKENEE